MTTESYLQFRRPDRECLLCGTLLAQEGKHPSILKLSQKEEAIRQDFCARCWENLEKRDYFSYWLTKRIQEGPSAEERRLARSERNEALWALFNALYAQKNPDLDAQLFLLAHLLMKYRVIHFTGTNEDGELLFLHKPTQESYTIQDLPLEEISFTDVKSAIDERLQEYAPGKADEAAPLE